MTHRTPQQRATSTRIAGRNGTRTLLGVCATLMLAAAAPAAATIGAKCPGSTTSGMVMSQYSGGVLRCQRTAIAQPVCPPTHLNYVVQPGPDVCKTVNVAVPPPGPLTMPPGCPANMNRLPDAGDASRDQCRGAAVLVPPLLGDY